MLLAPLAQLVFAQLLVEQLELVGELELAGQPFPLLVQQRPVQIELVRNLHLQNLQLQQALRQLEQLHQLAQQSFAKLPQPVMESQYLPCRLKLLEVVHQLQHDRPLF